MRQQPDSRSASAPVQSSHGAPVYVQPAHTDTRTLRASRERWGLWLLATLRSRGIAASALASGWWGVSESIVRRLFSADKPLTVAHVECGPDELAEEFVEEFVRRKFGERGALVVLGRVMGRLASKGGSR